MLHSSQSVDLLKVLIPMLFPNKRNERATPKHCGERTVMLNAHWRARIILPWGLLILQLVMAALLSVLSWSKLIQPDELRRITFWQSAPKYHFRLAIAMTGGFGKSCLRCLHKYSRQARLTTCYMECVCAARPPIREICRCRL